MQKLPGFFMICLPGRWPRLTRGGLFAEDIHDIGDVFPHRGEVSWIACGGEFHARLEHLTVATDGAYSVGDEALEQGVGEKAVIIGAVHYAFRRVGAA